MTRAEEVHRIAEERRLPEQVVAEVLESHDRLLKVQDVDDRDYVPLSRLPLTKGEHDGWPVGTRGEAVQCEQ